MFCLEVCSLDTSRTCDSNKPILNALQDTCEKWTNLRIRQRLSQVFYEMLCVIYYLYDGIDTARYVDVQKKNKLKIW